MGYVGNVICRKFMQKRFKVLSEKELVKNMVYLMWELNPRLSVHGRTNRTQAQEHYLHELSAYNISYMAHTRYL